MTRSHIKVGLEVKMDEKALLFEFPIDNHYVNTDAGYAACLNYELLLRHQRGVMRCTSNANFKALLCVESCE